MANFVNIHTHKPTYKGVEIGNFRLGTDTTTPEIPFSAGIHPWDSEAVAGRLDELLHTLKNTSCVAIGEIGLDKACKVDFEVQKRVFEAQLAIANERNLPVVVHCVRAASECLALLVKHKIQRAVFHGFIGSAEVAKNIISKGYYISFGATTIASPKTVNALGIMPHGRVFLESDTSDMPIEELYDRVAQIIQTDIEKLKAIIDINHNTFFNGMEGENAPAFGRREIE